MNAEIKLEITQALLELAEQARLQADQVLVVGCSTSEVLGRTIGTASNLEIGDTLVKGILEFCAPRQIQPAFQCCEHLNRALVVDRSVASVNGFDEVCVLPTVSAGGALAAKAMELLADPVVVEGIAGTGKAGIDIGSTLIGMHLHPVVVPVRIRTKLIGEATIVCAHTRPKLIGGRRAVYPDW